MKLAIRKEPGYIPGSGFHYLLLPLRMENDSQAQIYRLMGHIIVEVSEERGQRLLQEARATLSHQIEIAGLTEAAQKFPAKP